MAVDLILAILHHILVFSIAGVLAAEFVLIRPGLSGRDLTRVGVMDGIFGALAMAVIVIGICRVIYGLKGWEFYVHNHSFWAKMIAFAIVGLLSLKPTRQILRWRKAARAAPDPYVAPSPRIA